MEAKGCGLQRQALFEPPQEQIEALEPISLDTFGRAARSSPSRAAQTSNGFHLRHFAMLTGKQMGVAVELLHLVERVGLMPTAVQAI